MEWTKLYDSLKEDASNKLADMHKIVISMDSQIPQVGGPLEELCRRIHVKLVTADKLSREFAEAGIGYSLSGKTPASRQKAQEAADRMKRFVSGQIIPLLHEILDERDQGYPSVSLSDGKSVPGPSPERRSAESANDGRPTPGERVQPKATPTPPVPVPMPRLIATNLLKADSTKYTVAGFKQYKFGMTLQQLPKLKKVAEHTMPDTVPVQGGMRAAAPDWIWYRDRDLNLYLLHEGKLRGLERVYRDGGYEKSIAETFGQVARKEDLVRRQGGYVAYYRFQKSLVAAWSMPKGQGVSETRIWILDRPWLMERFAEDFEAKQKAIDLAAKAIASLRTGTTRLTELPDMRGAHKRDTSSGFGSTDRKTLFRISYYDRPVRGKRSTSDPFLTVNRLRLFDDGPNEFTIETLLTLSNVPGERLGFLGRTPLSRDQVFLGDVAILQSRLPPVRKLRVAGGTAWVTAEDLVVTVLGPVVVRIQYRTPKKL